MSKLLSVLIMKLMGGWKSEGTPPDVDKYIFIAAPHTSNWDLVLMLAIAIEYDLKISWIGKHTLFKPPFGWFMKRLGGIAVDRRKPGNRVTQIAEMIKESDKIALAVPAEGTRGYVDYWKSGFYHIACAAEVPIALGFLDFERKRGGFGPLIMPTGDITADMDKIREFYSGKVGKHPEHFGRIRLKEEDAQAEETA